MTSPSPPLSPTVLSSNSVPPSSPSFIRSGRRILPEPPKQTKSNSVLYQETNDTDNYKECPLSSRVGLHSPTIQRAGNIAPTTNINMTSLCSTTTVGVPSSSSLSTSPRPPFMQQFFSNLTVSSRDTFDRISAGGGSSNSPGSNTTTPSSAATGITWHSVSSRDSLDSGVCSGGHSRSTTCDSTSSNNSGGSSIGISRTSGASGEIMRNPPSPISSVLCPRQVLNESPPPYTRNHKWRRSYGARLPEVPYLSSGSTNDEIGRSPALNGTSSNMDWDISISANSTSTCINLKDERDVTKSVAIGYNRVQSLPSQDSSEKSIMEYAHLHHQQSLPATTNLSYSSEIYHKQQHSNKTSEEMSISSALRSSTVGHRVHFESTDLPSSASMALEGQQNSHEIENNQRNLGAHVRLNSPHCDKDILSRASCHGVTCCSSTGNSHQYADLQLCHDSTMLSTTIGKSKAGYDTFSDQNLNGDSDYLDSKLENAYNVKNRNCRFDSSLHQESTFDVCSILDYHRIASESSDSLGNTDHKNSYSISEIEQIKPDAYCVLYEMQDCNGASNDIHGPLALEVADVPEEYYCFSGPPNLEVSKLKDIKSHSIPPPWASCRDVCSLNSNNANCSEAKETRTDLLPDSILCSERDPQNSLRSVDEKIKSFVMEEVQNTHLSDYNSPDLRKQSLVESIDSVNWEQDGEDYSTADHRRRRWVMVHSCNTSG